MGQPLYPRRHHHQGFQAEPALEDAQDCQIGKPLPMQLSFAFSFSATIKISYSILHGVTTQLQPSVCGSLRLSPWLMSTKFGRSFLPARAVSEDDFLGQHAAMVVQGLAPFRKSFNTVLFDQFFQELAAISTWRKEGRDVIVGRPAATLTTIASGQSSPGSSQGRDTSLPWTSELCKRLYRSQLRLCMVTTLKAHRRR